MNTLRTGNWRPQISECLNVALGKRQWTDEELQIRANDPGFILNEAEAYAFRASMKKETADQDVDLERAAALVYEIPADLQKLALEAVCDFLSEDQRIRFKEIFRKARQFAPPESRPNRSKQAVFWISIASAVIATVIYGALVNHRSSQIVKRQEEPPASEGNQDLFPDPEWKIETTGGILLATRGGSEGSILMNKRFRLFDVSTPYQIGVVFLIDSEKATIKTYQTNQNGTLRLGCRGEFIGPACREYVVAVFLNREMAFLSDPSVAWLSQVDVASLQQESLTVSAAESILRDKLIRFGVTEPFSLRVSRFQHD